MSGQVVDCVESQLNWAVSLILTIMLISFLSPPSCPWNNHQSKKMALCTSNGSTILQSCTPSLLSIACLLGSVSIRLRAVDNSCMILAMIPQCSSSSLSLSLCLCVVIKKNSACCFGPVGFDWICWHHATAAVLAFGLLPNMCVCVWLKLPYI